MFWFFGHKACGILDPRPGIQPTPPALEGKVSTTGTPGKSQKIQYFKMLIFSNLPIEQWYPMKITENIITEIEKWI